MEGDWSRKYLEDSSFYSVYTLSFPRAVMEQFVESELTPLGL